MNLTDQERNKVRFLLTQRMRLNASGNYCDKFSEKMVGKALFRKMWSAGWVEQTGFYLNGRGCFCLSKNGVSEAKVGVKMVDEQRPRDLK